MSLRWKVYGNVYHYHWMDDVNDGDSTSATTKGCYFENKNYHVATTDQDPAIYCITSGASFSNFTYQVQMDMQKGHLGGIIFRQSPGAHFYAFVISDTGSYLVISNSSSDNTVLAKGTSNSINRLPGASNLLAVVANGSKLDLYVNQQQVASVTDSTYSVGIIGMIAIGDDDAPNTDMAYHDAKVWTSSK